MVLTLMIITRKAIHLEDYITKAHLESMNKIIIATGSVVGIAYITELFVAWYSGNIYEQYAFVNRAFGPYWWAYRITSYNVCYTKLLRRNHPNSSSPSWVRKFPKAGYNDEFVITSYSIHYTKLYENTMLQITR